MTGPEVLDIARDCLQTLVIVSAPSMAIALIVGLAVGLLQALTQIQEQTLSFVPKTLAIFLTLLLTLPFMSSAMDGFMNRLAQKIISG